MNKDGQTLLAASEKLRLLTSYNPCDKGAKYIMYEYKNTNMCIIMTSIF